MLPLPKKLSSFAGNKESFTKILEWAKNWENGQKQKPLLIFGPSGVGKTSSAHVLAKEFGWEIVEFNASDVRDENAINRFLSNANSSSSLFEKNKLILIDDVDFISSEDKRGLNAILKVVTEFNSPIILTATNFYDKKLQPFRNATIPIELKKLSKQQIVYFLKALGFAYPITDEEALFIAERANGDMRAALMDLIWKSTGYRDSVKNIIETVRDIFKSSTFSSARRLSLDSQFDLSLLKFWISQNIPSQYHKPSSIANAYNYLSKADVFEGRILRRQYWGFLRYVNDLASAGVALSKSQDELKAFSPISYPDYIKYSGISKSTKEKRKELLRKIAVACHCSIKSAEDYLLFILPIFNKKSKKQEIEKKKEEIINFFKFSESDIEFLEES